ERSARARSPRRARRRTPPGLPLHVDVAAVVGHETAASQQRRLRRRRPHVAHGELPRHRDPAGGAHDGGAEDLVEVGRDDAAVRGARRPSYTRRSVASDKVHTAATGAVLLQTVRSEEAPMHSRLLVTVALAALGALAGCAHSQSPVLYPNAKLQQVGKEQADRDVEACRQMASEYVSNPMSGWCCWRSASSPTRLTKASAARKSAKRYVFSSARPARRQPGRRVNAAPSALSSSVRASCVTSS